MEENTRLKVIVVILGLLLIYEVFVNSSKHTKVENDPIKAIDSLTYINDSLKNELFIEQTNVVRYEIALDRLKEVDSVSAQKFEESLYNIE